MRKLWPFVWIALAVAGGIALAPYFWWIAVLAGVLLGAVVAWRARASWTGYAALLVLVAVYGWPIWLASLGQYADAIFAFCLVTLVAFWQPIKAAARSYWLTVFPD